jgi:hypothetical protein
MINYKTPFKYQGRTQEMLMLCMDIQNRGIATVFFDLLGHVNQVNIRIHHPVWTPEAKPAYEVRLWEEHTDESQWLEAISTLRSIKNGALILEAVKVEDIAVEESLTDNN